jgi:tRNA pseudouridine38-40 synthase
LPEYSSQTFTALTSSVIRFHIFFHQLDNFETDSFLWVTAHGFEAAFEPKERRDPKLAKAIPKELQEEEEGDEDPENGEG